MTAVLLKRDWILIRKYWAFFMLYVVGAPFFLVLRVEHISEMGVLVVIVIALTICMVIYGNLCREEEKFPGTEILLLCAPCKKEAIVASRYLFLSIITAVNVILIEFAGFITGRGVLPLYQVFQGMAIVFLFIDIYVPIVYAIGIGKCQYILVFTVMGCSFGGASVLKTPLYQSAASNLAEHPQAAAVGFGILCLMTNIISYMVSVKIYRNKEFT